MSNMLRRFGFFVALMLICTVATAKDNPKAGDDTAAADKGADTEKGADAEGGGEADPEGTAEVTVDLTSPKSAAVSFAKAMEAGDAEKLRAATTGGTDEDYKMLEVLSGVFSSMKTLEKESVAKFGEEGNLTEGPMSMDMVAQVESSEEKIDGDTATLSNPGEKDPLTLKKEGDDWKVDLSKIPNKEEMAKALPVMRGMQKAAEDITAEVKADKYKTAEEAKKAFGMKMMAAAFAAQAQGGAPGDGGQPDGEEKQPEEKQPQENEPEDSDAGAKTSEK